MATKARNTVNIEIKESMRISLTVELKNDNNGIRNVMTLSSVIEEVLDNGYLLIQMPVHKSYHYPLPRDESLLMHFFVGSDIYALPVRFLERIERGSFVLAKMRRAGTIKPHQRRDCYRVPCSLPVTVKRSLESERDRNPEQRPLKGRMIDFSDGGMLFATDENIEKGESITVSFDMGQSETVEGIVLRTERVEDGKYSFKVAVQFKNMDILQKRRFYKTVLNIQMEERRRWTQDFQQLCPIGKEQGGSAT